MSISESPVAIVSGASRGIGKAIALRLSHEGYAVVGLSKTDKSQAVQGIDLRKADVSQEEDISQTIRSIISTYGRIDVVVNNAAIDIPGNIETYDSQDWSKVLATDLTSVFLLSKYAIPYLKKAHNANIINISSRLGVDTYATPSFVVYGAVKAAVNNFTVGLAKELQTSHIRVNAVIPTPTKTDLFDQLFTVEDEKTLKAKGKLGTPDEVAELVLQLINDQTVTGQLLFDQRVFL